MAINSDVLGDFYIQWHITNKCNLRCEHCYQEDYTTDNELSFEEFKIIADKVFTTLHKWNKLGDFSITGGEPFLHPQIFEILNIVNSSNDVSRLDILTNGTFITQEIIDRLKQFDKLRYIQISLDGSSPLIHDAIRGEGSFNKSMNGIRLLIQNGVEVRVMFTLQHYNMFDVPTIIDLCIKEHISGITIERVIPNGGGDRFTPESIHMIFKYISDRSDEEYAKGTDLKILKYRPLWINIDPCRAKIGMNTPIHKDLGGLCSAGLDGICVLPNADVLACRRLPILIGNLQIDSLEKIWFQSKLLWEIRDKSNLKGKCHSCEYSSRCGGCRSMAYAYTGDYLEEDPHCWKEINNSITK
jgi:radical SAM protein with 4Fe4S-binding SPASM domain